MHLDITEGTVKKGGIGSKPKGVRPSPPKGQGTQPTSNIARAEILPDACTVCRGRGERVIIYTKRCPYCHGKE